MYSNKSCSPWFKLRCSIFVFFTSIILYGCKAGNGNNLDANGVPVSTDSTGAPTNNDAYSAVQQIFDSRCTVCHSGAQAAQGLVLSAGQSYSALVGISSSQQSDVLLVSPNNPDDSYLVRKIRGDAGISGGQMPRNGPPFLSNAEIQTVIDWIASGAPKPTATDPTTEFIATLSDFTNYTNWQSIDYSIGPTNDFLGAAHAGDQFTFSRRVFANDTALNATTNQFPNGSILVKEVTSFQNGTKEFAQEGGLLAMVKRGQGFNPDHNDWEWFVLASDLSEITAQGADVMDNGCNICHQAAQNDSGSGAFGGKDYVFLHLSEFIAEASDFQDYKSWSLIDTQTGANELIGTTAHGASLENTVRNIYKKQLYANPDTIEQGYPVGTLLLKETLRDGEIIEITAMAKRGGTFSPDTGNWEWFMIDPSTLEFALDDNNNSARGANLMDGMCTGCHLAANTQSGNGIDMVFKHGGDPFNNNSEFVAKLDDFVNYKTWDVVDYTIGAVSPDIAAGHQGENNAFARKVYVNDQAVTLEGNSYEKGAIFVKEVFTWESGEFEFSPQLGLVAMAKRGENFNLDFSGWEWFELENDVSNIIGRGGNYRNNGCNSCHLLAETDMVFDHPSEFIANDETFANYQSWPLIDERSDQNPLLGDMAHQDTGSPATRKIYKKQLYAKPEAMGLGYPVGTTLVKEVISNNEIVEITAMVKRGGEFNAAGGHWEWFMLDPENGRILLDETNTAARGANLLNGMCSACHTAATGSSNEGTDFVFNHPGDPFSGED